MNNLDAILEVVIGLVAAWLILSVAVSQVQEWLSTWLGLRAQTLELAITSMLKNGDLVKAFYNHPLIQSLSQPNQNSMDPTDEQPSAKPGKTRKPSYIQAADFAAVMMDLIVKEGSSVDQQAMATNAAPLGQRINNGVTNIKQKYPGFGKVMDLHFPHLTNELVGVGQSVTQAQTYMENWYNSVQERASGWYKRQAMILSFVIGLVLALVFNIDSVQVATQLWKAPTIRQALVAQATTTAGSGVPTNTLSTLLKPQDYADSLAVPFGWSTAPVTDSSIQCGWIPGQNVHPYFGTQNPCTNMIVNLPAMNDLGGWIAKLIGILISGLAAAQGSPFWFNLLNKLINMRGSGGAATATTSSASTAPATPDGPVG